MESSPISDKELTPISREIIEMSSTPEERPHAKQLPMMTLESEEVAAPSEVAGEVELVPETPNLPLSTKENSGEENDSSLSMRAQRGTVQSSSPIAYRSGESEDRFGSSHDPESPVIPPICRNLWPRVPAVANDEHSTGEVDDDDDGGEEGADDEAVPENGAHLDEDGENGVNEGGEVRSVDPPAVKQEGNGDQNRGVRAIKREEPDEGQEEHEEEEEQPDFRDQYGQLDRVRYDSYYLALTSKAAAKRVVDEYKRDTRIKNQEAKDKKRHQGRKLESEIRVMEQRADAELRRLQGESDARIDIMYEINGVDRKRARGGEGGIGEELGERRDNGNDDSPEGSSRKKAKLSKNSQEIQGKLVSATE